MVIVVIAATKLSSENQTMNARLHTMNKIEFVYRLARFGLLIALGLLALRALFATELTSLKPPDKGQIPVAFLISEGAVVIVFCGSWEALQSVIIPTSQAMSFRLYTVAEKTTP